MDHTSPAPQHGAGLARLENLSDSVFSIAMTLLVLDITVKRGLSDEGYREALALALPHIAAYALSFAVIAQFWLDHRRILASFSALDGTVTALTLLGLGLTALLPFPTALLAEYSDEPSAVAVYALSVTALNGVHLALLVASHRRRGAAPSAHALRERRLDAADLAATVLVFGVTVPLAFLSPTAAKWCWLALFPAKFLIGRLQRRARTPSGGQTR